jgi:putative heme iron utilization protein
MPPPRGIRRAAPGDHIVDAATSRLLGELIHGRSVAALATLHEGRPFASMIPYAVVCDEEGMRLRFVTHVSRLSAHTRDMLESPEACLLVTAPEDAGGAVPPQALPRVSIPVTATFVPADHPDHESFAAAYLDRFPFAADWFGLGDFSIVAFEPAAARFVAGFARAITVSPGQLFAACRDVAAE